MAFSWTKNVNALLKYAHAKQFENTSILDDLLLEDLGKVYLSILHLNICAFFINIFFTAFIRVDHFVYKIYVVL